MLETVGTIVGIGAVTYATFVTVSYLEVKRKLELGEYPQPSPQAEREDIVNGYTENRQQPKRKKEKKSSKGGKRRSE